MQLHNVTPSSSDSDSDYKSLLSDMQSSSITIDSSPVTSSVYSATQEFLKASDPENDPKKRTAAPVSSSASSSASEQPLAEIISEKFPPFDSTMYIVKPFDAEDSRDVAFDAEYTTMLLEAVIYTHSWASARFKRISQLECQKLEDQNLRILKTEQEQGMCSPTPSSSTYALSISSSVSKFHCRAIEIVEKARVGLADFVIKMKDALAALTGVRA